MSDAAQLLASARTVLLDFDGPITPLMPPPENMQAANAARKALASHRADLPSVLAATSDHLAILRWAGQNAIEALADVEAACTAAEINSARHCVPTPGAHELLAALHEAGVQVYVVSNNAERALDAYFVRHRLGVYARDLIGRPPLRPELMKPHPHIINFALKAAQADRSATVLIGDSVSDIEVARAVGVRSIGYAKTPDRGAELNRAGADAVTSDMGRLRADCDRA